MNIKFISSKKLYYIIGSFTLLFYPYRISVFFKKIRDLLLSWRFMVLAGTKSAPYLQSPIYVKGHKYIKIGKCFNACAGFRIECWDNYNGYKYNPLIEVGDNVCFNFNCHLGAINKIVIGNNVLVGSNVLITDHSHGNAKEDNINIPPVRRQLFSKGPVIIENDVWIGENVAILPGVIVGQNSIIAANSVVTKNVDSYSIVAGNPAKIIKNINYKYLE